MPISDANLQLLTVDSIQCTLLILGIEITHGLAHHQAQFHLVVHADALGAEDGTATGEEDGGGRLEEEKGLLGLGVVELGDVIAIESRIRVSMSVAG